MKIRNEIVPCIFMINILSFRQSDAFIHTDSRHLLTKSLTKLTSIQKDDDIVFYIFCIFCIFVFFGLGSDVEFGTPLVVRMNVHSFWN